jgi:hypothetical protein
MRQIFRPLQLGIALNEHRLFDALENLMGTQANGCRIAPARQ